MDFRIFNRNFGNADLLLIDHILKGTFKEGSRILDAGCGEGRNLAYFLQNDYDIYGIDKNVSALRMLRYSGRMSGKNLNPDHFIEGNIGKLPFHDNFFDYVLCISVLHFSESESHFNEMLDHLVRSVKINGAILLIMNSVFGMENKVEKISDNKYQLPGGRVRFLLDNRILKYIGNKPQIEMAESPRTVMTHEYESNTCLLLKKFG